MKKLLLTAALPYSNGRLHVGHIAGCYLPADIFARYHRLCSRPVQFICGSDDHGVAIMLTAEKEGKTPAEVAKHYHALQEEDFRGLGISFDIYGATSRNPFHTETSQQFFLNLFKKGIFEKQTSRQFYDTSRAMFLPDRFVQGTCSFCGARDQNGDQCENCGKVLDTDTLMDARSIFSDQPAEIRETVHWFIDLTQFEDEVEKWFEQAELREQTKAYLRGLLSAGLVKRSMTRDIDWGIPLPLDDPDAEGKVLYVWFDAPIGYISNTQELCGQKGEGPDEYGSWWKSEESEIYHFIGEDNTIFHCVIWIAMLSAEGSFELPKGVIVNQFLNIQFPDKEEEKISKSRGTAIWIGDYLKSGGNPDALRYYLTSIAPERARTVFKPEDLVQRTNTDLANTVGNFVNRILSFTSKYYGPQILPVEEAALGDRDRVFRSLQESAAEEIGSAIAQYQFKRALEAAMEYAREGNRYVDELAPWKTRKEDEDRTKQTLALCMEAIFSLGLFLKPFLPFTADKILSMLGFEPETVQWDQAARELPAGQRFGELGILFEKMEPEIFGSGGPS